MKCEKGKINPGKGFGLKVGRYGKQSKFPFFMD